MTPTRTHIEWFLKRITASTVPLIDLVQNNGTPKGRLPEILEVHGTPHDFIRKKWSHPKIAQNICTHFCFRNWIFKSCYWLTNSGNQRKFVWSWNRDCNTCWNDLPFRTSKLHRRPGAGRSHSYFQNKAGQMMLFATILPTDFLETIERLSLWVKSIPGNTTILSRTAKTKTHTPI